ncbi:MAG: FR47-like protein [Firmicutes bacterium]|nr:FR47-like protein [Bacillota bacterium]
MMRLLTGCDISEVEVYLERNHMETVFFSGNLARCGIENDGVNRRAGDYYGYFSECGLQGIAAFYNLGNVVTHFEAAAAVDHFAEIMRQRRFEFFVGLKKMVEPLSLALQPHKEILGCEESYFYVNQALQPNSTACLHQIADVADIEQETVLSFIVEAYRQGFQRRFNREMAVKLIEERGPEEDFVFFLINGEPVAQAIIQVVTGRLAQIGGVYTREEYRGKGYCKALVAELCRRIFTAGRIPALLVRQNNIPALKAYHALGFTYYDEYLITKFRV